MRVRSGLAPLPPDEPAPGTTSLTSGGRRVATAAAVALLLLVATVVTSASASAAAISPPVAKPAPAMPAALADAAATVPISAPAYFTPSVVRVRTRAGDGPTETVLPIALPGGTTPLWGDWWGRGVETPAYFKQGSWAFYDTVVGPAIKPVALVTYGQKGDRPVAGDWDGDGRTDIGVQRGTGWFLTTGLQLGGRGGTNPASTDRFTFGLVGGVPLAGDFDGDGVSGVASYRLGTWRYREVDAGEQTELHFAVPGRRGARASDEPVVGDWNGDGVDQIGLVRGATWRLRSTLRASSSVRTRRVGRPAQSHPAPWRTTAGPTGASCPTASDQFVTPSIAPVAAQALDIKTTTSVEDVGADVRTSLITSERYLLGAQYTGRWAPQHNRPYLDLLVGDTGRHQELAIRRPAMAALAVAIGLRTDAYDHVAVGRTRNEALQYVDFLVRSIACQHASVTPRGGWGWGWQTAHWANLTAEAAWLVWDDLPTQTRAYVTSMVLSEAAYRMSIKADYWRALSGEVNPGRDGNTAAEEVAWNSAFLDLAAAMYPDAPQARRYRAAAVQLQSAAFAVPADLTGDTVINGVRVADRIDGTNALPDGTVVNHHRIHPDYMGNIQHLWWSYDFAALSGSPVPQAAGTHAALVYDAFTTVNFTPGEESAADNGREYVAPGGTIYSPTGSDPSVIYYPDGTDWGPARWAPFMSLDAHADAYGLAPGAAWPAEEALRAHTSGQMALVARSGTDDGRTYSVDPAVALREDNYEGREEYAAQQLATTWLALYLGRHTTVTIDDSTYAVPESAVGGELEGFRGSSSSRQPTSSP